MKIIRLQSQKRDRHSKGLKYRITMPLEIVKQMRLKTGDEFVYSIKNKQIIFRKVKRV